MSSETRKKLLLAFIILWLGFIWGHSLMPREVSSGESIRVTGFIASFLKIFFKNVNITNHFVRKLAHFAEFAVLGGASALYAHFSKRINVKSVLRCLEFVLFVALTDETLQLFSGRGSMVKDIWLDFGGAAVGTAVIALICLFAAKRAPKTDGQNA